MYTSSWTSRVFTTKSVRFIYDDCLYKCMTRELMYEVSIDDISISEVIVYDNQDEQEENTGTDCWW